MDNNKKVKIDNFIDDVITILRQYNGGSTLMNVVINDKIVPVTNYKLKMNKDCTEFNIEIN